MSEPLRRRCYHCDVRTARYASSVAFELTPEYLLCDECAIWLRDGDDIVEIHSMARSGAGTPDGER